MSMFAGAVFLIPRIAGKLSAALLRIGQSGELTAADRRYLTLLLI